MPSDLVRLGSSSDSATRRLNVRFMTDFPHCNFSCDYCIAGHGVTTPKQISRWDTRTYTAVIENLTRLPYELNTRLGVAGEFFLSKDLVAGARKLASAPNCRSVNLITNLSLSLVQYERHLRGFPTDRTAIVASLHPQEIKDLSAWIELAEEMSARYDLAVVMVGFPPILDRLEGLRRRLQDKGIVVFVQPFIGVFEGRTYPADYEKDAKDRLASWMYSRHDVEYLLNLKKPGRCFAGHRSIFVEPDGKVFPCGMGPYAESLGDLSQSPELTLRRDSSACPFNACQCDTENINTVQFHEHYEFTGRNQHKYVYRFRELAKLRPELDEWAIDY